MECIEKEGLSVAEAVFAAVRTLGIEEKDAQVQVLSAPGARRVRVRVAVPGYVFPEATAPREAAPSADSGAGRERSFAPRPEPRGGNPEGPARSAPLRTVPGPEALARAADDLRRLLTAMGIPATVEMKERWGNAVLNVLSPQHEGLLVGRRGQTQDALQTLILEFMARREGDASLYLSVDVADTRGKQDEALVEKALGLARQVMEQGGQAPLGQLSSAQRRVVHVALKAMDGVETFSVGHGSVKKLIIQKKA